MDAFSYLSVLISIVLGLGITQLLSGMARWVAGRAEVKLYGPAVCWAFTLLLIHVQTWWTMFPLRLHSDWNFLQFAVVLLQPSILYLLAALAVPGGTDQEMRGNYFAQRRWFFGGFIALLAVSLIKDLVREGGLPTVGNLIFHGAFAAGSTWLLISNRDIDHRIGAFAALGLIIAYVALLFANLA